MRTRWWRVLLYPVLDMFRVSRRWPKDSRRSWPFIRQFSSYRPVGWFLCCRARGYVHKSVFPRSWRLYRPNKGNSTLPNLITDLIVMTLIIIAVGVQWNYRQCLVWRWGSSCKCTNVIIADIYKANCVEWQWPHVTRKVITLQTNDTSFIFRWMAFFSFLKYCVSINISV